MQSMTVSEIGDVQKAGSLSTTGASAHPCFRGARWLVSVLAVSLGLWVIFSWGVSALVGAL